jgi:hypothetical protein
MPSYYSKLSILQVVESESSAHCAHHAPQHCPPRGIERRCSQEGQCPQEGQRTRDGQRTRQGEAGAHPSGSGWLKGPCILFFSKLLGQSALTQLVVWWVQFTLDFYLLSGGAGDMLARVEPKLHVPQHLCGAALPPTSMPAAATTTASRHHDQAGSPSVPTPATA